MFYDIYCILCEKHGLTPSGGATKIGFSRASVTMWKNTGKAPKQELLVRIADFFGVTVDYLLGQEAEKAPAPKSEGPISDDEMKFALWGDTTEMDDEDLADVRRYAAFLQERKKNQ